MASSSLSTFSMLLFLALAFSFIAVPSFAKREHPKHKNAHKSATVDDLCSKTKNPSLCVTLLRSDPRSKKANEQGLTEILIDIAYNKSNAIFTDLYNLDEEAKDYDLKRFYGSAAKIYYDLTNTLFWTNEYLIDRDYSTVLRGLEDSARDVKDAARLLSDRRFPSELKDKNNEVGVIFGFIKVFVKRLKKHG